MGTQSEHDDKVVYNVSVSRDEAHILEIEILNEGKCSSVSDWIATMIPLTTKLNESTYSQLHEEYRKETPRTNIELSRTIMELEDEYFQDMTFMQDSIVAEYINEDIPFALQSLSLSNFRFYITEIDIDTIGRVHNRLRTMMISPEHVDDKQTLLHEMIHAYEAVLSDYESYYRDMLVHCLYKHLAKKIEDLDDMISKRLHIKEAREITDASGPHGLLFYLKSLDLDLQCGFELGTVYHYD